MRTLFTVALVLILWPLAFSEERWMPGKPASVDKLLGKGPWLPAAEQAKLKALWPKGVDWIDGLKFYKRTEYSQRLAVTNNSPSLAVYHTNQDDHWGNSGSLPNPNRLFPISVSGGLHNDVGWKSSVGVAIPAGKKISVYGGQVAVAGAGRYLPRQSWTFPVGTIGIDMLSAGGEVFELRKWEKTKHGWEPNVMYRGGTKPANYVNAGKACASCHDDAGASKQYGILWRGDDNLFSVPILAEGTVNFDFDHWPLDNGIAQVQRAAPQETTIEEPFYFQPQMMRRGFRRR